MPETTREHLRIIEAQGARVIRDDADPGVGESMIQRDVSFIRRTFEGGWHYYLVNTSDTPFNGWLPLSVPAIAIALLDPMTEQAGMAAWRQGAHIGTEVFLQLDPGASIIVRAFWEAPRAAKPWMYAQTIGEAIPIEGRWQLTFIAGGPELPYSAELDRPQPWTDLPGDAVTSFAGTATYRIVFDSPRTDVKEWTLDLGKAFYQ